MTADPTTVLDMSEQAVLERAADVIDARGLATEFYVAPGDDPLDTRPVCALGAIAVACGLSPVAWSTLQPRNDWAAMSAAEAAGDLLVSHLGLDPDLELQQSVGRWNDATADPAAVAATLRQVAKDGAR